MSGNRRPTQKQRVLAMLEEAGSRGVTTAQFLEAHIPRFGGRILELRDEGHRIETHRVREGSFRYVLVSSSPPVATADDELVTSRCMVCGGVATAKTGGMIRHQEGCINGDDNPEESELEWV